MVHYLLAKVDEDGESSESSEDEPQTPVQLVSSHTGDPPTKSSTGGGPHAVKSSTTSLLPLVGAEPDGVEQDGEKQETTDGTVASASQGVGNGRLEARNRSRLQQGARVSRARVARLWSKLRAVAYITSLQVPNGVLNGKISPASRVDSTSVNIYVPAVNMRIMLCIHTRATLLAGGVLISVFIRLFCMISPAVLLVVSSF